MFTLYTSCWSDNVSGNTSKQYNPHTNIYLANANLPHEKLQQEFFMHFHSMLQHASSSEQFCALENNMYMSTHMPHIALAFTHVDDAFCTEAATDGLRHMIVH